MKGLDGKVALLTGAGRGIGRSVALALAARGVRLVVTGRDERALGETVGEIAYGAGKARHVCGDVRDAAHLEGAVDRALEVFGGLDIVIANAGVSGPVALGSDLARAEAIVTTALMGATCTLHASLPRLRAPGRILFTGGGLSGGDPLRAAVRAGVIGLVEATAASLGDRNITCNAILPSASSSEEARDREASAIAELAVFLCSSGGDAITGQAIAVSSFARAAG